MHATWRNAALDLLQSLFFSPGGFSAAQEQQFKSFRATAIAFAIAAAAAWVSSRRASANKTATAEPAASSVGCRPRLPTARAEGADK